MHLNWYRFNFNENKQIEKKERLYVRKHIILVTIVYLTKKIRIPYSHLQNLKRFDFLTFLSHYYLQIP